MWLLACVSLLLFVTSAFAQPGPPSGGALFVVRYQTDCTTITGAKQLCVDSDTNILYMGNGTTAVPVSGAIVSADCAAEDLNTAPFCLEISGGTPTVFFATGSAYAQPDSGGSTPSLPTVLSAGRSDTTSNSLVNATRIGGNTCQWAIYESATTGCQMDAIVGGAAVTQDWHIYSGETFEWKDGSEVVLASVADTGIPTFPRLNLTGTTCLSVSSDRIYHDTDCDGTKDAGEEFIDQAGGAGDIEGVTAGVGLSGGGTSGTVSLAVDLSTLVANQTLWNGANDTRTLTLAVTGTDPVASFSASLIDLSAQPLTTGSRNENGTVTYGASGKPAMDIHWRAGDVDVDGTNCVMNMVALSSYPAQPTISCLDNDNGRMVLTLSRSSGVWDAGVLDVTLAWHSITNQSALTAVTDMQVVCTASGEQLATAPATGTTNTATATFGNQTNDVRHSNTVSITTSGCAAGEQMRLIMDNEDSGTATQSTTTAMLTGGLLTWRPTTSR